MFENSKCGTSLIKNVATEIKIEFPNIEGFLERNSRSMKLFLFGILTNISQYVFNKF